MVSNKRQIILKVLKLLLQQRFIFIGERAVIWRDQEVEGFLQLAQTLRSDSSFEMRQQAVDTSSDRTCVRLVNVSNSF